MIRRLLLAIICLIGTFLTTYADEQKKIVLNNDDHKTEKINLDYGNIFVSLKDVDENDNVEVSIELENIRDSITLYLFDRAYDEKSLKKYSPSITYDKVFGGTKGKRNIDNCSDIKYPTRVSSRERSRLFSLPGTDKLPMVCKLPIYIAKNKNKSGSKMLLLAKDVIILEIQVQLKPDEEYENFKKSYENLIKEIDSDTFCKNKNHPKGTSFAKLKNKYEGKVSDLKKKIKAVVDARDYYPQDKAYKKFMEIYDKLGEIDVESKAVGHCQRDRKPKPDPDHHCNKCSMSYEAIYKKLDSYYRDIDHHRKTKAQVMSDVEALYFCVRKNTKRGESSLKEGILNYYDRIKKL